MAGIFLWLIFFMAFVATVVDRRTYALLIMTVLNSRIDDETQTAGLEAQGE
jgi:hypothetical protein